jgi:predicted esterase
MQSRECSIEVTTHGRYLISGTGSAKPLLVGFHGYAESAEIELDRLRSILGSERWLILAIQGLHRFYRRRTNEVVASWMTKQNREFAIKDNSAYVTKVINTVSAEYSSYGPLVLSGFSQGVGMAFRAAAAVDRPVSGVIALGGDVPPELGPAALSRISAVLLGSGSMDEFYTREKAVSDEQRLRAAGVNLQVFSFDGGHEWTDGFEEAASRFLYSISSP